MRIDKFLANKAIGSRKEVHQLIKQGLVSVNGVICQRKDMSIDLEKDRITLDGQVINNQQTYYIKLNKPAGYVTALEDSLHPTVMDLLPPAYKKMGLKPVGRLDKDTEGLLLLTTDGQWGHRVIHGRKDCQKKYYFTYEGQLASDAKEQLAKGLVLRDGTQCKPAKIEWIARAKALGGKGYIWIEEGKYHQVKRMIAALGGHVTYLKRISIDEIGLNGIEELGQYKELTEDEYKLFSL